MIWLMGFGIILAIYIPMLILAIHYEDELIVKVSNRVYWFVVGTWDICYAFFLEKIQTRMAYYMIFGLVCIWLGGISLIRDYVKKEKDS